MVISFLVLALIYSSPSTFNVFGAPPSDPPGAACWTHATGGPGQYTTTCCWTETDPADPEGIEIDYCQHCDYDPSTQTQSGCGDPFPPSAPNPGSGRIPPGDIPRFELEQNSPLAQPSDIKDAQEIQPSNTDFGSTVADERSELSMNEENNDDSTKLNSQDNSIGAEQIENGESQNQSSQD